MWPELEIVAEARNGQEAVRLFEEHHPDISLLDTCQDCPASRLRTTSAGARISCSSAAYDHYPVQASAQGALDYLLKPVEGRGSPKR